MVIAKIKGGQRDKIGNPRVEGVAMDIKGLRRLKAIESRAEICSRGFEQIEGDAGEIIAKGLEGRIIAKADLLHDDIMRENHGIGEIGKRVIKKAQHEIVVIGGDED